VTDTYADDLDEAADPTPDAHARSSARADAPAAIALALALAEGHLIEAAIDAHRIASHAEAARRLGVSEARVSRSSALTALAPEIQTEVLALREFGALRSKPAPRQRATSVQRALAVLVPDWTRVNPHLAHAPRRRLDDLEHGAARRGEPRASLRDRQG
jgi:hypothetical protein